LSGAGAWVFRSCSGCGKGVRFSAVIGNRGRV
jgi:hypothetical protein